MMSTFTSLRKYILLALILTVTISSTSLFPKEASAQASGGAGQASAGIGACIGGQLIGGAVAGYLGSLAASLGLAAGTTAVVSTVATVPVTDYSNLAQNTLNTANTTAQFQKETVLDPIFYCIAKVILRQLTTDIVNWINGGFDGNPAFLEDPGQFFTDLADQTAQDFLMGTDLEFLCSPFKLQVRLALALNYSSRFQDKAKCTWSEVADNIGGAVDGAMEDFTGGNFSRGGWPAWFRLTQNQSNNPYGSFLTASSELELRIGRKQSIQLAQLNWGKGFLSYEECIVRDSAGKCLQSKTVTPGAVIESQLENALGSDIRNLELADEFNEIMQALMNQLLTQIFTPGGGGLRNSSVPPLNISGNFCQGSPLNVLAGETVTWRALENDSGTTYTWSGTDNLSGSAATITKTYATRGTKNASVVIRSSNGDSMTRTCSINVIAVEDGSGGQQCVPAEEQNLALRQTAQESSSYEESAGPGAAVDGSSNNCGGTGFCSAISQSTTLEPYPWWQVDLDESVEIDSMNIYPRTRRPLTDFYIFVSNDPIPNRLTPTQIRDRAGVWSRLVSAASENPTIVTIGQTGRYVRIMRTGGDFLELVEVEVNGIVPNDCPVTQPPSNPGGNPTDTPVPTPQPQTIPTGARLITDYGARSGDGQDDMPAIIAAANAAGANGVIGFPAGTYNINGSPTWPANRQYIGNNATLVGNNSIRGGIAHITGDNIKILGLAFQGGGVVFEKPGSAPNNIEISWNTFVQGSGEVIRFEGGLSNSVISNNYFTGNAGFALYGYHYNNLRIANNECVNINACMHIDSQGGGSNGLMVEKNYMKGLRGMGMEFQSTATNLTFRDNWYEHPNAATFSTPGCVNNSDCRVMAFSLPLDGSSNIVIRRNGVVAPERPDGIGTRVGFELGGDNTLLEDNYINYINHSVAVNDCSGTASITIRNNKIMNERQGIGTNGCFNASGRTYTQTGNGPSTNLTWSISAARFGIGNRVQVTGN